MVISGPMWSLNRTFSISSSSYSKQCLNLISNGPIMFFYFLLSFIKIFSQIASVKHLASCYKQREFLLVHPTNLQPFVRSVHSQVCRVFFFLQHSLHNLKTITEVAEGCAQKQMNLCMHAILLHLLMQQFLSSFLHCLFLLRPYIFFATA